MMHFIGSQMYLEHCHPILRKSLKMALIAITGNSLNSHLNILSVTPTN